MLGLVYNCSICFLKKVLKQKYNICLVHNSLKINEILYLVWQPKFKKKKKEKKELHIDSLWNEVAKI